MKPDPPHPYNGWYTFLIDGKPVFRSRGVLKLAMLTTLWLWWYAFAKPGRSAAVRDWEANETLGADSGIVRLISKKLWKKLNRLISR